MGQKYAEAVILNLEKTWTESDPVTPLVCLLSMGSDPTASIENLAKNNKLECRSISMGQGKSLKYEWYTMSKMCNFEALTLFKMSYKLIYMMNNCISNN